MKKAVKQMIQNMRENKAGYKPKTPRVDFLCKQMEHFGYCYELNGFYYLQDDYLGFGNA